jgi:hypothetical protein
MARTTTIQKTCEFCNVAFFTLDPRKRFCNRSCSASFTNNAVPRRKKLPLKDCIGVCSRQISARSRSDYCSTDCKHISLLRDWWHKDWVPTNQEFPAFLRDILIIKGCSLCGWNKTNIMTGKGTCQIDHINGNPSDHSFDNIRVLCPNCHSLTMNYGALNKGNGRTHRRRNVDVV